MGSPQLFYESWEEAAREVVRAAGGTKKVAVELWPAKPLAASTQRLTDCLNHQREEKLSPDELMLLLRIGKDVSCHALIEYMSGEVGYSRPLPVSADDEKAQLMRGYIEAVAVVKAMSDRLVAKGLA